MAFCCAHSWDKQLVICLKICLSSLRIQLSLTARIRSVCCGRAVCVLTAVALVSMDWLIAFLNTVLIMCLLFAIKWPYNELLHIVPLQGLIKVEVYVEVLYCMCISSNTSTSTSGCWKIPKKVKHMKLWMSRLHFLLLREDAEMTVRRGWMARVNWE